MKLDNLVIDPDEARAKLAEYEGLLAEDRTREDEDIAAGYRAAERGLGVIRLSKTIQAGGFFSDNGLPRIAVCRADATECAVRWSWDTLVFSDFDDSRWENSRRANRGALVGQHTLRVNIAEPPEVRWRNGRGGKTIVPLTPPRHRPRRPRRLSRCHVLWEVEKWEPIPPADPALIRHIRGDLWAVLAVWDLTELERAVLAAR